MLRIFGDRQSLLAALSCHWSYELIQLDQPLEHKTQTQRTGCSSGRTQEPSK